MNTIDILSIGSSVIPLLTQGIQYVESLFSGKPKSGGEKKDMVMQFATIAFASLGSQADEAKWEAVKPHVSIIIDEIVAVMNGLE